MPRKKKEEAIDKTTVDAAEQLAVEGLADAKLSNKERQFLKIDFYVDSFAKTKGEIETNVDGAELMQLLFFMMSTVMEKMIARLGTEPATVELRQKYTIKFVERFLSRVTGQGPTKK